MEMYTIVFDDHLEHHGIKGQKWGVRRYQNPDGSLTEEGRKRYGRNTAVSVAAGTAAGTAAGIAAANMFPIIQPVVMSASMTIPTAAVIDLGTKVIGTVAVANLPLGIAVGLGTTAIGALVTKGILNKKDGLSQARI